VALAIIKGKSFAAALGDSELKALGIDAAKEFELLKIKNGIWILSEKENEKQLLQIDETAQKIFGLLKKKSLKERVEGVFEKSLDEKELEKFEQLLKQGRIVRFKLDPSYKKAVYKLPEDQSKKKQPAKELVDKQNIEDYNLASNGFLVVRNEERAKRISEELEERIKSGEIKGIKSFDGSFYIIETGLLESLKEKVSAFLAQKKNCSMQEIAKALGIGLTPVRIACEFLKEDGTAFEKKKEMVCYID